MLTLHRSKYIRHRERVEANHAKGRRRNPAKEPHLREHGVTQKFCHSRTALRDIYQGPDVAERRLKTETVNIMRRYDADTMITD